MGFRYTARNAANMYRLTGYVRNEYDGSVTCEVQGEQDAIDEFIRILYRERFIDISYVDKTAMDTNENIKYSLDIMKQASGSDKQLKIGIVTNSFHVFRGLYLTKKLTDDEVCGIAADTIPWYLPNNMVRECFGIIRDLLFVPDSGSRRQLE